MTTEQPAPAMTITYGDGAHGIARDTIARYRGWTVTATDALRRRWTGDLHKVTADGIELDLVEDPDDGTASEPTGERLGIEWPDLDAVHVY